MNRRHTTEHGSAKKSKKNRVAFTPHGGITAAEVEKLINDIKPEWEKDSVKYDPRHWLGNLLLIVDNKHSAMMPYIATMFSDALFKMIEGEYELGHDHLKQVRPFRIVFRRNRGRSFESLTYSDRSLFRSLAHLDRRAESKHSEELLRMPATRAHHDRRHDGRRRAHQAREEEVVAPQRALGDPQP